MSNHEQLPDSQSSLRVEKPSIRVADRWDADADVVLFYGDTRDLLTKIPNESVQLIITSPPYNLGKSYERRRRLAAYLREQGSIIRTCIEKLAPGGSICWQVGHYVDQGEVFPLDVLLYKYFKGKGLRLRNRIVWHFEHGLHCTKRFSGRHETILWFTKDDEKGSYVFNLDPVRVPQKYPGKKHYKGPNKGKLSGNPKGKNPGDVWIIPNVKHNHVEKTIHPCQFPVELAERLVLALSNPGDWVLDPFMGVGSTLAAAILNDRRAAGADIVEEYVDIARQRVLMAANRTLPVRPRGRPVYVPSPNSSLVRCHPGDGLDLFAHCG